MSLGYVIRRLLGAIPLLLGISVILFAIIQLAPGGPLDIYAENPSVSKEALAQIAARYGLDQPVPVQYLLWLKAILVGDWGYSIRTGRPVLDEIVLRLGPTLQLGGLAMVISLLIAVPVGMLLVNWLLAPMTAMFRALEGTVSSYRDGDFAFSLAWEKNDELGDLVAAHNELGATLRKQRESLVHRELLLDTMLQNTPVAMMLVDQAGHVVFGNIAARKLLTGGKRLEGQSLSTLLERALKREVGDVTDHAALAAWLRSQRSPVRADTDARIVVATP